MNLRPITSAMLAGALCLASAGCMKPPGKPGVATETRPEQVLDFPTLFKQNCAACHGYNGVGGAAISLANPVYLATAGVDNIRSVLVSGVPGTLMPPFGKKAGGMLTDAQLGVISQGMIDAWGSASALNGATPLPYAASNKGDAVHGQAVYATFCASCHGADGTGSPGKIGSIVEPAYLALVNDQGLRSIVIAGRPDLGMPGAYGQSPNMKAPNSKAMTDQEVTDVVAWLASQRTASPGQPYPQHP